MKDLERFTGLSTDFIERSNLRIVDQHFFKELLRESGRTVGQLDSRFLGIDRTRRNGNCGIRSVVDKCTGPLYRGFL